MCLIVFSWQPDNEHPFIVLANRDEFYQRPTQPVNFWEDNPNIFGGRDLKAGGSWLATDRRGRLAAVTNFREFPAPQAECSRGELVSQFLSYDLPAYDYLQSIKNRAKLYGGFNLLIADDSGLYHCSNRSQQPSNIQKLSPGCYGLCNHLLDTPWPKLTRIKTAFKNIIHHSEEPDADVLIQLMRDEQKVADHLLPDTGIGLEWERLLSSPFISSKDYGTRNTSLLVFNRKKGLKWTEQSYLPYGKPDQYRQIEILSSQS